MARPDIEPRGELELYQGVSLKVHEPKDILQGNEKLFSEHLYIGSRVMVNEHGVVGFIMVDSTPEKRNVSYTDMEWTGITYEDNKGLRDTYSPDRIPHFVGTEKGFKMIRYFAMPKQVAEFFGQDKFLGEPFIDKCIRDETLPEDFDEELGRIDYSSHLEWNEIKDLVNAAVMHVNPEFGEEEYVSERTHRVYFSFFPWQVYVPTMQEGEDSIRKALTNFDNLLSRFDNKGALKVREDALNVRAELSNNPQLQLQSPQDE